MIFLVPLGVAAVSVATVFVKNQIAKKTANKAKEKRSSTLELTRRSLPISHRVAASLSMQLSPLEKKSASHSAAVAELQLNAGAVSLALAGFFFFYPLELAGIVFLAPTIARELKAAWQDLRIRRRVTGPVLNSIVLAGCVAGGFLLALNVGGFFLAFVRWLAIRTEDHSEREIVDLFGRQTRSVWLIVDGAELEVPFEAVEVGDVIAVHAGQMVPVDGIIVGGNASIDEHLLTGEAQLVEKGPGDPVLAGTMLLAGRISVRVEKGGDATTSAQIGRILADTTDYRSTLISQSSEFNDTVALPWLVAGAVAFPFVGLSRSLAFLWVSPGYRMVLFGPLSILSYLRVAAKSGILIKDGRALDLLPDIDTVIFDKTGTLTLNQPHVRSIWPCPGFNEETVLAYAAAAETKQHHPIARAILTAAEARDIKTPAIDDVACEVGYGVTVHVMGEAVHVGSDRFMGLLGIAVPPAIRALQDEAHAAGYSLVLLAVNYTVAGGIVLEPTIRPETETIVRQLKKRGLRLYILSGDHEAPTRQLAGELGMEGYYAEVLPEEKAGFIEKLQAEGRKICFVGDGINDSTALKTADVSISLHGAATIAMDTAQIVLMDGDLAQLPRIFSLADEFAANMKVNYFAATFPSVVIAAGALFFGVGLLPAVLFYQLSVPFAMYNAVRPLLAEKRKQKSNERPVYDLEPLPEAGSITPKNGKTELLLLS